MRGRRLSREEIVTLNVLATKGEPNTRIAELLDVTEGAVRYHRRNRTMEKSGNAKSGKAQAYAQVITHWVEYHKDSSRPVNVKELYEHLVLEHGYQGSYKSVLRYMRAAFGPPALRTYRRVETPPGAQSQTDWGEFRGIRVGYERVDLHAFVMTLSHSRMTAVIWSKRQDQLAWHGCHNRAFRRLEGVAAVNRVDNAKTAVGRGAGAWGEINVSFKAYARAVGFHVDACQPRAANAKGKVEAKVKLSRFLIDPASRDWIDLDELQRVTDQRVQQWAKRATCPATGQSVWDSWRAELEYLAPLPLLPEPFDIVVSRKVRQDCTVSFEGRFYTVPFRLVGRTVEVRGCPETVQILTRGAVVQEYPRRSKERVLIDQSCYAGDPDTPVDGLLPPLPLGRMGQRLQEIMDMPVQSRPIDLYASLAEVAR